MTDDTTPRDWRARMGELKNRVDLAWRQSLWPVVEGSWHTVLWLWSAAGWLWVSGGWKAYVAVVMLWRFADVILPLAWDLVTASPVRQLAFGMVQGMFDTVWSLVSMVVTGMVLTPEPPPPSLLSTSNSVLALVGINVFLLIVVVFLILKPRRVIRVCDHGFLVEKTVQGSEFITAPPPDFIGEVWGCLNNSWTRRGTFFRVGAKVFTAEHVVIGCDRIRLHYKDKQMELPTSSFSTVDLDLASAEYEPISSWQMASGKFTPASTYTMAACHNGTLMSYGRLSPALECGYMEYNGSTLPGFSGAPYYCGKRILGMHLGEGVKNLGYDGAYMRAIMTTVVKPESIMVDDEVITDPKAILRKARQAGKVEVRRTGNDYVVVKVDGKYHTMTEDRYDKLQQQLDNEDSQPPRYKGQAQEFPKKELPCSVPKYVPQADEPLLAEKALFTWQDTEDIPKLQPGNGVRPAVRVTAPAGRASTPEPEPSACPPSSPLKPQLSRPPSPPRPRPSTSTDTAGQMYQHALQSVVSAYMSGASVKPEDLVNLSKSGMKAFRLLSQALKDMPVSKN